MPDKLSFAQFGAKIKASHPEYGDMADDDIGRRVYAKYPQYADMVNPGQVPVNQLENLKAVSAQPTQFEKDRPGSNRPNGGGWGQFQNVLGSMFTPSGDMRGLERTNIAPSSPQLMDEKQAISNAAVAADQSRKQAGYSPAYRVGAQFVPGSPQMEESARRGDTKGVYGAALAPATVAAAAYAGPKAIGAVRDAIPSFERAGANFNTAMEAAANQPVATEALTQIADRAQQIASSGGTPSKLFTDFMKRLQDTKNPITYAEIRDFAANAGDLSMTEKASISKRMYRQIGQFAREADAVAQQAANQTGVGDYHSAAMSEYRNASRLRSTINATKDMSAQTLQQLLTKGVPLAAGAYGAKKIYDASR